MSSYKFIIIKDDGEQREVKVKWDTKAAEMFQRNHGLDMKEEVAKHIGFEIGKEIMDWENEGEGE